MIEFIITMCFEFLNTATTIAHLTIYSQYNLIVCINISFNFDMRANIYISKYIVIMYNRTSCNPKISRTKLFHLVVIYLLISFSSLSFEGCSTLSIDITHLICIARNHTKIGLTFNGICLCSLKYKKENDRFYYHDVFLYF